MPMRDAAQVACVSKAFVRSWRCHPNLHFSKETLGLNKRNNFLAAIAISNNPGHASVSDTGGRHMSSGDQLLNEWKYQNGEISRELNTLVDRILRNHICIGVKSLKFCFPSPVHNKDGSHLNHLETLLSTIVKPGIEELHLLLPMDAKYNFPCSLLSGGTGDQLRCLFLACCHFHPAVGFGCLRSLIILKLTMVNITARQLGRLLFSYFALEQLELRYCNEIVHLKIPCLKKLATDCVQSRAKLQISPVFALKVISTYNSRLEKYGVLRNSKGPVTILLFMLVLNFHPECQILKLLP
jgi:hypothetical protein